MALFAGIAGPEALAQGAPKPAPASPPLCYDVVTSAAKDCPFYDGCAWLVNRCTGETWRHQRGEWVAVSLARPDPTPVNPAPSADKK
jgi:hypothetical protein